MNGRLLPGQEMPGYSISAISLATLRYSPRAISSIGFSSSNARIGRCSQTGIDSGRTTRASRLVISASSSTVRRVRPWARCGRRATGPPPPSRSSSRGPSASASLDLRCFADASDTSDGPSVATVFSPELWSAQLRVGGRRAGSEPALRNSRAVTDRPAGGTCCRRAADCGRRVLVSRRGQVSSVWAAVVRRKLRSGGRRRTGERC